MIPKHLKVYQNTRLDYAMNRVLKPNHVNSIIILDTISQTIMRIKVMSNIAYYNMALRGNFNFQFIIGPYLNIFIF